MKPVQVWEDKYTSVLKSNGWGGNGGRKWPKNWREREEATAELDRILGRQVLVQLAAKKAEAGPAGESAWGERVCCLLVLNLVSSTLPCIRQPRPRLRVLDICGFVSVCTQAFIGF